MADDPFSSQRFQVEISGITVAQFREVGGLLSSIDVIEYRDGSEPNVTHKIPGRIRYENVTLKRGLTADMELYNWHLKILNGEIDRRSFSVILLDAAGNEVARWNFINAWPCKYSGPLLNAQSSEIAIETLEIAHEGMQRVK
jgi:phage tail-like protein